MNKIEGPKTIAMDLERIKNAPEIKSAQKPSTKAEKEIEKAASGFEALLLHQLMKGMWETVDSSGFLGEESNQAQIFRDMFHQAVADSVADGRGIGVKELLKKELTKTTDASKSNKDPREL